MIPGSNLLKTASRVIGFQAVQYFKFLSRAPNVNGIDANTYAAPVTIKGSWQPVPRALYEQYGLNLNRNYITFYTSSNIIDVQRGVAGDQLGFNGKRYQVESENEWTPVDGWTGVIAIELI